MKQGLLFFSLIWMPVFLSAQELDYSKPGDVLITEVMANPVGLTELPETEYVEIYNASDSDVSLNGWSFIYDGKETKLPDIILSVGIYAVLYRSGRDISVASGSLSLGVDKFPSALANIGKTIGLKNSKGEIIDELEYPNATAGKSYERATDGTWHLSTDEQGGTPGAVNSQPPGSGTNPDPDPDPDPPLPPVDDSRFGDVLITEVMANPVGLIVLPETEYVEIYNASGEDIPLNNWSFVYDGKETKLPDIILSAGIYAVLYRSGREISVASGALSLGIDKFPSALANTSKVIGLKNSKGEVIDELNYPNATAGKSYERSADGTWHLSTDGQGGTPGAANSQPPDPGTDPDPDPDPDPEPPLPPVDDSRFGDVLITEVMANPVGLTAFPETEYVEIYNVSGNDISLSGWSFVYDEKDTDLPDIILPGGAYAVLYRSGREISVASGGLSLGIDKFPSALANTGKTIGLKNSKSEVIDELNYPNATAGRSYERSADGTWHLCTDEKGGTPGAANSQPPDSGTDPDPDPDPNPDPPFPPVDNSRFGDILITEVMANPVGLTVLPETEYVEIYNVSGNDISLSGWSFVYDGKETALPEIVFPSGTYAVLYRSGRDISVASGSLPLGVDKFPSALANTSKMIGLKNSKGEVINEISYPNATAGKSYERATDGTWHLCTDEKGGTPGAANSPPPEEDINPDPDPDPEIPLPPVDNSRLGDVWITEVMANPTGLTELPETEYVEIYNTTKNHISLSGWVFVYDGKETALPVITLPAGCYAVLYRSGREITVASGALSLGVDKFPSALANTGKTIGLKNSRGEVIDEMSYPNATAGQSYEKAVDGTWHLSTDKKGGTPGAANSLPSGSGPDPVPDPSDSSQPGDVLINEIMANPVGLTKLPETEYVELYNASDEDVSFKGWVFVYDGKETILPDTILPKKSYAVLYRSGREITVASGALSLGLDKFPSALANTGKTISLKNSKGGIIDEISYPNATAGKSYERANDSTWHLSTDEKGGTPGAANSLPSEEDINPDPDPNPDPPFPPVDNSQPGDVLINEVMANPVGLTELPETEYVELYNASGGDVSFRGWVFVYDGREAALPDTIIPEAGYVVLYRSGREIAVSSGALSFGLDNFPSALANTGKIIGLKNSKGEVIDAMEYPDAVAGQSYERSVNGTWHLSTDRRGGTPGAINSQLTGTDPEEPTPGPDPDGAISVEPFEIIINEILPDPFTGGSEYIELYNRSGRSLSLSTLAVAVRKADGTLGTTYSLGSISGVCSPGNYIVLTKETVGVTDFYTVPSPESVCELKLPTLNNEGASLVLFRLPDMCIIDEVSYSAKWHDASIKTKKGVSLERIDPDGDSQDVSNWTSGTAETGYGTPGYQNSQHKDFNIQNNTYISTPEYVPGFNYYVLAYQTDKSGYRCRAEVYSTNGKKMAEISNNQLMTQNGELHWDGTGSNNDKLSPGVYVFYAELYHPDGSHRKFKKAFLVK